MTMKELPLAISKHQHINTKCHLCGGFHREQETLKGIYEIVGFEGLFVVARKNRKKAVREAIDSATGKVLRFTPVKRSVITEAFDAIGEELMEYAEPAQE